MIVPRTVSLSILLTLFLFALHVIPAASLQIAADQTHIARPKKAPPSSPQTIRLSGGLLHPSNFYFKAKVGGQTLSLEVDISYSSLIVPRAKCKGCRLGDHRYSPANSSTSLAIPCDDARCRSETDQCRSEKCFSCSSGGNCCTKGTEKCAFNMLYGDGSSGNGTLFSDTFQLEALRAQLLFGVMHEESHNFELPYADGFFGLAFQKGACHPACIPPVMDSVVKQTGIQNIFTMCVSRYGGTLVLGAADRTLATQEYSYIDMVRNDMANRFVVPVMSEWKIGARSLDMPGMVGALWSTSTTNIGLPKNAFMALLDHLLKYHCNVPNLCSANSWFRPLKCSAMTAEMVGSMPNVTIPLSESESLTLTPEDYLVKYRIIGGVQHRCVAFAAMIGLEEKGAGVLLGTCVMSRYAIVFDRSKRRVGLSYANTDRCGPKSGSDVGLPAPRQGELKDDAILTADSPLAKQPVDDDDVRQRLNTAEICRAENECSACAQLQNCSFGYQTGRCVPSDEINGRFYPYCSGVTCMCIATGPSGWYVGIVLGVILGICMTLVSIMMYRKRARRLQYESVQTYEEQDLETF